MSASRDYYADLELPRTADIPEVKKQFRKLALKYHPDRNPGREQEVNSKFLIIQAAHEILSDPQEKAKYDATLSGRTSRYPAASGVRGNPWSGVSQQFPPPPRRTTASRNQTSGAQRWERFSGGVPPTAKQPAASASEAKKNAAKAFEGMRTGQSQGSNRTSQRGSRPPPPPPQRTETQKQRAEASFGTRKSSQYSHSSAPYDAPPPDSQSPSRAKSSATRRANHTTMPDPLRKFREADDDSGIDDRQRTPYTTHGGEKTNPFDGVPQSDPRATDGSYGSRSNSRFSNARQRRSSSVPKPGPADGDEPDLEVPEEDKRPHSATDSHNGSANASYGFQNGTDDDSNIPYENRNNTRGAEQDGRYNDDENSARGPDTDTKGHTIFNYPPGDDAFARTADSGRFERNSIDNINTKFTEDGGPGQWRFNAGQDTRAESGVNERQAENQNGRQSPAQRETEQRKSKSNPDLQTTRSEGSFDAEGWSDKFGPQTFVPRPDPKAGASPTRTGRANSKKSTKGRPTAGNAAMVDETSDDDQYQWAGRKGQPKGSYTGSPQAMDIDSPPFDPTATAPEKNDARNIPVEPSRPEWRSGSFEGLGNDETADDPIKKQINPNAVGSEDSEEFRASFADLRNVPPFAPQGEGLKSFTDLKDNLPFESAASGEAPVHVPKAQPLVFPAPPRAPKLPPTVAISSMKPNVPSWQKYVEDFKVYMQQWDDFNAQVVDHFYTRKAHISRQRASKGYDFLGSRDDTDVQEYYSWIQQDNDVRRRWLEACNEHELQYRGFLAFREKMK